MGGAVFEGALITTASVSGCVFFSELEGLSGFEITAYCLALLCILLGIQAVAIGSSWKEKQKQKAEEEAKAQNTAVEEEEEEEELEVNQVEIEVDEVSTSADTLAEKNGKCVTWGTNGTSSPRTATTAKEGPQIAFVDCSVDCKNGNGDAPEIKFVTEALDDEQKEQKGKGVVGALSALACFSCMRLDSRSRTSRICAR